jgi:hypothetical protein
MSLITSICGCEESEAFGVGVGMKTFLVGGIVVKVGMVGSAASESGCEVGSFVWEELQETSNKNNTTGPIIA